MKINSLVSVTVSALNQNINQDLDLGNAHTLKTDTIDGSTTNRVLRIKAAIVGSYDTAGDLTLSGADLSPGGGARIALNGNNRGLGNDGCFVVTVPNAAKTGDIVGLKVVGNVNAGSTTVSVVGDIDNGGYVHRNVALVRMLLQPQANLDAIPFMFWLGTFSTVDTFNTGTPTVLNKVFRYYQIGKTVFFEYYRDSTDSNGCTSETITLPIAPAANSCMYQPLRAIESSNGVFRDPMAYIDLTDNLIHFANFLIGIDGTVWIMAVSGSYEVA